MSIALNLHFASTMQPDMISHLFHQLTRLIVLLEYTLFCTNQNSYVFTFAISSPLKIIRLAAIFHAAENWCDGGKRSKIIGENEISRAISVYDALTKTFTDAVESNGYAGERSEFDVVAEKLRSAAQKGKTNVTVKWLYDSLKNVRPFKGIPKIYDRLRSSVLPSLEEDGYCVFIGNTVHINPRLK
jgi:hypothetical protein